MFATLLLFVDVSLGVILIVLNGASSLLRKRVTCHVRCVGEEIPALIYFDCLESDSSAPVRS